MDDYRVHRLLYTYILLSGFRMVLQIGFLLTGTRWTLVEHSVTKLVPHTQLFVTSLESAMENCRRTS